MEFDFAREKEQSRAFFGYWLKRIFIDDWLMKLFALLITFALWLGVSGLQEPITRPLTKVRLNPLISSEYVITNTPTDEIELVIEGDKRKVNPLRGEDLVVTIDLTDIREGERTIQLTPQNIEVDLPSGVKVNQIRPDKIAVNLDRVEEYDVEVRAETEGEPAKGFEVYGAPRVVPEKVRVRGPQSYIKSLNFISTEKIDISGRRNDFTVQQVPLNVSNSKVSLVNSATVSVTFRIGPERVESLFFVPYKTVTRSGRASVLLYGASTILENLIPEEMTVVEDENAEQGLRVVLPEAIRNQVEIRNAKFRE
jgi:YbbR domain-containing protein